jgi:hypothetical protein
MKTTKHNITCYNPIEKLHNLRILSLFLLAYLFVIYQGSAGATGTPISIYAPSFDAATIASFQLNGNAVRTGDNKLQLTSNAGGQNGSAFWKSRIYLGTDKSFSAYFTFLINGSVGGGADGLAFVLQTSTVTAGSSGGGIGYQGISPSIAVEFDTYDNGENGGGNHVAIVEDGHTNYAHTNYAVPSFALDGGIVGHVWVDYNGATDLFEVRLSTTTTRPASALVSATKDLASKFANNNVYVGFTAATGGSSNYHFIQDLMFENSYNTSGVDPSGSYEQAGVYTISYHVTSDGTTAVPGASVAINGVTLTTDGSGNASLSLADGVYPYTVSKAGSTSVTGITTVSAAPVTQNITLVIPPTITVSPTSLNLGYVVPGGTSGEMSYTLSGIVLSPSSGNITITPPANFEVSFTSGSGFSSSAITAAYTSGSLAERTVYVRFKPTSTTTYFGSITNSGGTATTQNVDLTGTSVFSYCSATTSTTCCMGINNVTFNTINNSTDNINYIYTDYTAISTNVTKGRTYALSLTGYDNPQYFRAWFDWNHDGDFDDAGELYEVGNGMEASSSVTIPSDASTGNVRMRVRSEYYYNAQPTACGYVQYGECEEYTVNVEEPGPFISISPTSLNLGYTAPGGTSGEMSYTMSGSLLSPSSGNITITPPANFEVSFTSGSGFSTSAITVAYTSGTLTARTIYVRFKPTSVTSYAGSIINSGGSATTENVDLTGTSDFSYCSATTNETCCMGINNVTFNTINNSTDYINYIYTDFTAISTNVTKGQTYTLSLMGYSNPQYFMTWFDWNHDGDFDDTGESYEIGSDMEASSSITIPSDATSGNIRMRVRSEYLYNSPPTPCGNVEYGECEDYTVIVEDTAPIVWDGSESTDWNTPGNWSTNAVPTASDNATIPDVTNDPIVNEAASSPATCNNLTIETGVVLTIGTGKALTVNGVLANNNGINGLVIESDGSLIQHSEGVAATVKRVISDASDDNWHLFISPITSSIQASASSCFSMSYLDRYDEPSNAWARLLTNENVTPYTGYSINFLHGSRTLIFPGLLTGSPATFSNLSKLSNDYSNEDYGPGWNLVGNPYTCSIDLTLCDYPADINPYAYTWNVPAGNYMVNSIGDPYYPGTIAPLQGFFVLVRNNGNTNSFTISNAAKTHGGTFFKSSKTVPEMLKINIQGNHYSDITYVRFDKASTANFDQQYDAYKLSGSYEAPQLYSILSGEKASANTLPSFITNSDIALGLKVGAATTYNIIVEGINSFDPSVPISLDDLKQGTSVNLRLNPTYSFTAAPGDAENRFRLSFAAVTGIHEPDASGVNVNAVGGIIHITSSETNSGKVYVYSTTGQLLATSILNSGETTFRMASTGVYMVKVVSGKTSLTRKIVVLL